jgi:hypothetical protein
MKKILSILVIALVALTASAYNLTIGTCEHGTIAFKVNGTAVTNADAGKTVTVSISPEKGYFVESVTSLAYIDWGDLKGPRRSPGTLKEVTVTGGGNEWTFTMPEANVEVSASLLNKVTVGGVTVELSDSENGEMTITSMEPTGGVAVIPSEITIGGVTYDVTAINADAFSGQEVTDVYLPDTEKAIAIASGTFAGTVNIHTPLALLDDYALMASLQDNFEALKVMASVVAPNKYWTLSSGVDIVLPEGLKAYTAYLDGSKARIVDIPENSLQLKGGRRGIKANNGVFVACVNGKGGGSYEIVASPGNQTSGTTPSTGDARSYAGNKLVPTIEATNYTSGSYYVLKDNKFHSIKNNTSKVKACKAVLIKQ